MKTQPCRLTKCCLYQPPSKSLHIFPWLLKAQWQRCNMNVPCKWWHVLVFLFTEYFHNYRFKHEHSFSLDLLFYTPLNLRSVIYIAFSCSVVEGYRRSGKHIFTVSWIKVVTVQKAYFNVISIVWISVKYFRAVWWKVVWGQSDGGNIWT